jgi:transcriptional regulator of acetoin/glycerol metabolism
VVFWPLCLNRRQRRFRDINGTPFDTSDDRRELVLHATSVSFSFGDGTTEFVTLAEHEKQYILTVLEKVNGNKTKAAKILGIDRVSLWRKLKKYNCEI